MALSYNFAIFLIASVLSILFTLTSVKADLINDVCSKTQKPAICLSALNGDPRSKGANLEGLGTISIDLSQKNAKSTHDLVSTLLTQATDPNLKRRYTSCLENYNDALNNLGELYGFLNSKDYDSLNIHASAASDDPSTCDDNFSGPPTESPQLKDASDKLQGLIGITLVISNQLKGGIHA
ncbi:pectinesterase inhibitor-like [Solanum dulcamara]|uniref:pectinesterase inhibitor-like n=1 Tax=Solanum dulcamara TaxID=45834 RepID=UPI002486252F|nr:pectinesterase inhibitor-like [Solanum dulcamara]